MNKIIKRIISLVMLLLITTAHITFAATKTYNEKDFNITFENGNWYCISDTNQDEISKMVEYGYNIIELQDIINDSNTVFYGIKYVENNDDVHVKIYKNAPSENVALKNDFFVNYTYEEKQAVGKAIQEEVYGTDFKIIDTDVSYAKTTAVMDGLHVKYYYTVVGGYEYHIFFMKESLFTMSEDTEIDNFIKNLTFTAKQNTSFMGEVKDEVKSETAGYLSKLAYMIPIAFALYGYEKIKGKASEKLEKTCFNAAKKTTIKAVDKHEEKLKAKQQKLQEKIDKIDKNREEREKREKEEAEAKSKNQSDLNEEKFKEMLNDPKFTELMSQYLHNTSENSDDKK